MLLFLTLESPITTAADDTFCDIFLDFWKNDIHVIHLLVDSLHVDHSLQSIGVDKFLLDTAVRCVSIGFHRRLLRA